MTLIEMMMRLDTAINAGAWTRAHDLLDRLATWAATDRGTEPASRRLPSMWGMGWPLDPTTAQLQGKIDLVNLLLDVHASACEDRKKRPESWGQGSPP